MKCLTILLSIFLLFSTTAYGAQPDTIKFPDYVIASPSGNASKAAGNLLPIIQSGTTKQLTLGQLLSMLTGDCTVSATTGAITCTKLGGQTPADYTPPATSGETVCSTSDNSATPPTAGACATERLLVTQVFTQCTTIKDPTASSDHVIYRAPVAMTITAIHCLAAGGTSLTGSLQECDDDGANCAGVDGATTMVCTAGTNVNDDGALSNPSIDAGDYIKWDTASVSGTQTELIICFDYTMP